MIDQIGCYSRNRTNYKQTHSRYQYIQQQLTYYMGNNQYITTSPLQHLKHIPFTFGLIVFLLLSAQIIEWQTAGKLFPYLTLDPLYIFWHYQVWRFMTGWLCQPSVMTLVIVGVSGWSSLVKFQYKNSSSVLFNDFMANNFIFSIFFFIIQFALSFLFTIESPCTFSFVTIWINLFYKCCFYNSHESFNLCITRCKISWMYYPFLLFLAICCINCSVRFDALLGLTLAILECKKYNGGLALYTKDTYEKKETYFQFCWITSLPCWQTLNNDKIQENQVLTVSSSQFYINLYDAEIKEQLPHEQPMESNNLQISQGQISSIS